ISRRSGGANGRRASKRRDGGGGLGRDARVRLDRCLRCGNVGRIGQLERDGSRFLSRGLRCVHGCRHVVEHLL
ncbi:hypothetical protein PENTCL1PPCAC_24954, partial [Pristionchus entomophagus]